MQSICFAKELKDIFMTIPVPFSPDYVSLKLYWASGVDARKG